MTQVKVEGLSDLLKNLQSLPLKVAQRLERIGLKRALEPMKQAAEALAPVGDTGRLADSFKIKSRTRKGVPSASLVTTVPYAHLVEYGHRLVKGRLLQKEIGHVGPKAFMRPAFDANAEKATGIFRDETLEALKKLETKK